MTGTSRVAPFVASDRHRDGLPGVRAQHVDDVLADEDLEALAVDRHDRLAGLDAGRRSR